MKSIKDTPFYQEAIQELKYPFGSFYLFENYIVGEINEDVVFTWEDHAKVVTEELSNLYENNGESLVYITNRIHSYAVRPSDWLKFYNSKFKLKAYAIVSYTPKGRLNALIEKLFMKNRIQSFEQLRDAIAWVEELTQANKIAS